MNDKIKTGVVLYSTDGTKKEKLVLDYKWNKRIVAGLGVSVCGLLYALREAFRSGAVAHDRAEWTTLHKLGVVGEPWDKKMEEAYYYNNKK